MAVLKMVNYKNSDMAKQKENIDYISNPVKRQGSEVQSFSISGNYEKAVELNRYLHRKGKCKRYFKHFIVSLGRERPLDKRMLGVMEMKLCNVLRECGLYYIECGFSTLGAVHCNTQHMHFHIQIDTCNCFTGKQWSQSKQDLVGLKEFVSQKLLQYGLGEEVLCNVQEVAEEEMLLEEDMEYLFGNEDSSGTAPDESDGLISYQCPDTNEKDWNNGTTEQINQFGNERPDERLDSQHYVQEQGVPQIVDKTKPRKLREMCEIVDNTELREMCIIVDKSKPREMCRIVD